MVEVEVEAAAVGEKDWLPPNNATSWGVSPPVFWLHGHRNQ